MTLDTAYRRPVLLRIELNDKLFVHDRRHLLACWDANQLAGEIRRIQRQPDRNLLARHLFQRFLDYLTAFRLVLDLDDSPVSDNRRNALSAVHHDCCASPVAGRRGATS